MDTEQGLPVEPQGNSEPAPAPVKAPSSLGKKFKHLALLLLFLLVCAAVVSTSVYTVPAGHGAAVLRLGNYAGTAGPGLRFKLPFGIDRTVDFERDAVRTESFGFRPMGPGIGRRQAKDAASSKESSMITGDLSIIGLEWTLQYRCADPGKFLFFAHDRVQTVRDAGEEAMRGAVGDASLDFVLQNRDELARACRARLQASLDSLGAGIRVVEVRIQDISPPDPVKAAFEEVNAARQERDTLIQEALSDYNREVPRAMGESRGMVSSAEGYAVERVNRARGEAARFTQILGEYRGAREVTKKRLYLETCREVMPKARQVIVVDGRYRDILPRLELDRSAPAAGGGK